METKHGTYHKTDRVRVRPMNEWNGLLAYTPNNPNIFYLNATSWAILELCEGKTPEELETSFVDFVSDVATEEEAKKILAEGLTMLEEKKIVEFVRE